MIGSSLTGACKLLEAKDRAIRTILFNGSANFFSLRLLGYNFELPGPHILQILAHLFH
jgi:hypothetical protein